MKQEINKMQVEFLKLCCNWKENEFEQFWNSLTKEQKDQLIAFNNYEGFYIAIANGNYEIIDEIFYHVKKYTDEVPTEDAVIPFFVSLDNGETSQAFQNAVKEALLQGHIDVIERLLIEEDACGCNYPIITILEESLNFINILWHSRLKKLVYEIFERTCSQSIDEVNKILNIIPKEAHYLLLNGSALSACCSAGKVEILTMIWNMINITTKQNSLENCLASAIAHGHLEIAELLLSWSSPEQQVTYLQHQDYKPFVFAAADGYYAIVKLLWSYTPIYLRPHMLAAGRNFAAYRYAKERGFNEISTFLEDVAPACLLSAMKDALNEPDAKTPNIKNLLCARHYRSLDFT